VASLVDRLRPRWLLLVIVGGAPVLGAAAALAPTIAHLRDIAFEETAQEHLSSTTDFTVPYEYAALSPGKARTSVLSGAGTGVLNIQP
jgi:hypothetical protein